LASDGFARPFSGGRLSGATSENLASKIFSKSGLEEAIEQRIDSDKPAAWPAFIKALFHTNKLAGPSK
jgi:hypothetical protein